MKHLIVINSYLWSAVLLAGCAGDVARDSKLTCFDALGAICSDDSQAEQGDVAHEEPTQAPQETDTGIEEAPPAPSETEDAAESDVDQQEEHDVDEAEEASAREAAAEDARIAAAADWTVLFYMVGDRNRGPHIEANVRRILNLAQAGNVGVGIQYNTVDGPTKRISAQDGEVEEEALSGVLRRARDTEMLVRDRDMTDPESLEDFAEWGLDTFNGRRIILCIVDGGVGIRGVGPDLLNVEFQEAGETTTVGLLEAPEREPVSIVTGLRQALNDTKLELVVLDGSFTASLEVATEFRRVAHYMAASQGLIPGVGFDFGDLLVRLNDNPDQHAGEIAGHMVEAFGEFHQGDDPEGMDRFAAVSAINLGAIASLNEALSDLLWSMDLGDTAVQDAILRARGSAASFTGSGEKFIDIAHFLSRLDEALDHEHAGAIATVLDVLEGVISANYQADLIRLAQGLSLYLPSMGNYDHGYRADVYDELSFASEGRWGQVLDIVADSEPGSLREAVSLVGLTRGALIANTANYGEKMFSLGTRLRQGGGVWGGLYLVDIDPDHEGVRSTAFYPGIFRGGRIQVSAHYATIQLTHNGERHAALVRHSGGFQFEQGNGLGGPKPIEIPGELVTSNGSLEAYLLGSVDFERGLIETYGLFSRNKQHTLQPGPGRIFVPATVDGLQANQVQLDYADEVPELIIVEPRPGTLRNFLTMVSDKSGQTFSAILPSRVPSAVDDGGTCEAHSDCADEDQLCLYGGCFAPFGESGLGEQSEGWGAVEVQIHSVTLTPRDRSGDAWDWTTKPDPYAQIQIGGEPFGEETDYISNEYSGQLDGEWELEFQANETLGLCFFDADPGDDDVAGCLELDGGDVTELIRSGEANRTLRPEGPGVSGIDQAQVSILHQGVWR